MAGEQYFQVAATNVINATLEMQKEIDAKKLEIAESERQFHKLKDELEGEKRQRQAESGRANVSDIYRAEKQREAMEIDQKIRDAEQNFKMHRDQLTVYIDNIQRDITGLQTLISDLNRRAANV